MPLHLREGGTRVNAFASGGVIPVAARGTKYDGLLALVDWFPTVCHLAGITTIRSNLTEGTGYSTPPHYVLIGVNLLRLMHCTVSANDWYRRAPARRL